MSPVPLDFWDKDDKPELSAADQYRQMLGTIFSDAVEPTLDALQGHHAACEARGFSPAVADAMTMQYQQLLLNMLGQQIAAATLTVRR